MPTENPQVQAASARVNERIEQGAQRVEQGVQSASNAAIEQVREVRERAEDGIEQQRALVSSRVRRFGEAIRSTSDQLSREDQFAQNLLDNASERVQRVADYIDRASFEDVAQDVQTFARRQPAVFFGGAFLLGLAVGRFVKSSGQASIPSSYSDQDRYDYEDLPAPASRSASSTAFGRSVPATSTSVGAAAGVNYAASLASEPPRPQTSTASAQPHTTEPGQGTKS